MAADEGEDARTSPEDPSGAPVARWIQRVPYSGERAAAIGVIAIGDDAFHCGVLHRVPGGAPALLHLRFHCMLEATAASSQYVWVLGALEPEQERNVAARCRDIARQHLEGQQIPYGIHYSGSTFGADGVLRLAEGDVGLTCATFVLAVYESVGVHLLDLDTWRPRSDDETFRRWVVRTLRDHDAAGQADAVEREPRGVRYRPTEVAAATSEDVMPVPFAQATELAATLESAISEAIASQRARGRHSWSP